MLEQGLAALRDFDCDLMDGNISVMNKYSELYYAAVSSLVYKGEHNVGQILFTRKNISV